MNEVEISPKSEDHPFITHQLSIKETLRLFSENIKNKHKTNHISDYQKLNLTEKTCIVSSLMNEHLKFDPLFVFEKDGHDDLILKSMIRVIETEGIDDKANTALANSLMSVFIYGTDSRPAAFSAEVTEALVKGLEG